MVTLDHPSLRFKQRREVACEVGAVERIAERRAVVDLARSADIAVLTADQPPVNALTAQVRSGLLDALERIADERGLRALVLRCAGSTFFSGADISEFSGPPREAEFRQLFARIESLPIPVIAAMHGTVLGGGLELALACHYRIAAPGTSFGFPELRLGIFPGAGGTQRAPRLIGVEHTLELILSTRPIGVAQALQIGLLDEALSDDWQSGALDYARRLLQGGGGPRRTCERAVDEATASPAALERLRAVAGQRYPGVPAASMVLDAVGAALRLPFAEGLAYEARLVNEAKRSVECRAAVHVFFAEREARRLSHLPAAEVRELRSCGIVGAGTMGRGIAQCFANAGLPVTLLDADERALARGLEAISRDYESMAARGRIDAQQRAERLALVRGTLDYAELGNADVLIEAVFEDMALKQQVFGHLDRVARPGAVIATNTSTLDIGQLARATGRAGDVIGMHFFMPAQVMPLLEVVRTGSTSAGTIRSVMQLARALRKTPVLAKLCYGFIGNRMMEPYAREAERMTLEGASPRQVDAALERWGMAMGILSVFDMAGLDVGVNVHRANRERYPPDPTYYQADVALTEAGRLGRKNGRGFYCYGPDGARQDDPQAQAILEARAAQLGVGQRAHADEEIVERCVYALTNEAFRILEEGVAQRAGDIDVVWTAGYGFPRYRGGPLFYAESIGLARLLDGVRRYRDRDGPMHWEPAPLLVELVRSGRSIQDWEREAAR